MRMALRIGGKVARKVAVSVATAITLDAAHIRRAQFILGLIAVSPIPDKIIARLYLEPLLQMKGPDGQYIRWTDIRMIRRMLRDAVYRAYKPKETLEHWHYVRASELASAISAVRSACMARSESRTALWTKLATSGWWTRVPSMASSR